MAYTHVMAEYWSRRMQRKHFQIDTFRDIANFEEEANLKTGDKVHRQYRSDIIDQDYTRGTAVTIQDVTDTDEELSVTTARVVPFYIDDLDALQSNYKLKNEYADDAAEILRTILDGYVLAEYDQAATANVLDAADIGGTAGEGITLTTANIQKIFGKANLLLDRQNLPRDDNRWAVISPEMSDILWQFIGGKESLLGDKTGMRGHIGQWAGFKVYMSNNLGWSGRLEFATNPTDGDTITINGVTLTWKATLGTTAGNIHICSSAATSLDQLVAAINTPGTSVTEAADAGFVALSAANQALLRRITATDGATYMTLKAIGKSYIAVSETLTAAADIWTTTKQNQHVLFGWKRPIDMVVQARPSVQINKVEDKLGYNVLPYTLFGVKTFNEGTKEIVDCRLRSDAY